MDGERSGGKNRERSKENDGLGSPPPPSEVRRSRRSFCFKLSCTSTRSLHHTSVYIDMMDAVGVDLHQCSPADSVYCEA